MRIVIAILLASVLAAEGVLLTGGTSSLPSAAAPPAPRTGPDFDRAIRPILADRCFRCHGPDSASRKHDLRLDTEEGSRAVVADGSLAARIASHDPEELMPPPDSKLVLEEREKRLLLDWIAAGAVYAPHWAFVAPRRPERPAMRRAVFVADPLDSYVEARLESEGLAFAPEADRATLLRRVALALTGIPPTPEETAAFEVDQRPDAYEREVDRLLASPRFGERMASDWLDAARYADTFGYQSDWECRTWPWRDWVIAAFNDDLPYDRFLTQQLAGDLLPDATRSTRIASAFNRLHRQTNEGGSIDEEFRQEAIADRVQTFGTAMLGLTLECARCHDHKYDPIPQRDYYSLAAHFGAIDEAGTYPYSMPDLPSPTMRLGSAEDEAKLASLASAVADAEAAVGSSTGPRVEALAARLARGERLPAPVPILRAELAGGIDGPPELGGAKATSLDGDSGPSAKDPPAFRRSQPLTVVLWIRASEAKPRATILHTSQFTLESDQQGYQLMMKDGRLAWEVIHLWPGSAAAVETVEPLPLGRWVQVAATYDGSSTAGGMRIYLDGEPVAQRTVRDRLDGPTPLRTLEIGHRSRDLGFAGGSVADLQLFDRCLAPVEVAELRRPGALEKIPASEAARQLVAAGADDRAALDALRQARSREQEVLEALPELMVMAPTTYTRPSYVLTRGRYDQPDHARPVASDRAIDALLPFDPGWPHDRAGLARWVTDPRNPLTARVAVNRLWASCFGRGLVVTQENFGVQGERPSEPELLDLLAVDFVASGWKVKAMLRRIVLSSTFRQASQATAASLERDPSNALHSRGPSGRLSAEMLREIERSRRQRLLVETVGGPSVKPWQPPGLWEDAGVGGGATYVPDQGPAAHRRSLYTFRKRTAPPPDMILFDAGSREQCQARRLPTNTPLQQLVLLNDPVFVECAVALARRAAAERPDDAGRVERIFALLASRPPRPAERAALLDLLASRRDDFRADPAAAAALLGADPDPELAALSLVASTVLASDAALTTR